ncbi:calcium channel, voltage-dependent, gamma subunit 7a isoform X1 [Scomber japonicus]|uniref:calcium channel, voltage-dependent, gamma subunit 7a isoform X1 n=1 Tax=Scomber japonicus TaxID=13676 RepID=UPI002305B80E|nr:calcium channel, voltage-dependent, gamma subunit 7a isoform X1 [Scomber japonicus]
MSSFSTRALTLLSSVFGACGLLLVGVAVSTDYWLLMEEGIVLQQNQTTEVKMALHSGLWRVCFVAGPEKGRCVASEYFTEPEIEITTENTANILKMVRTATPFPMISLLFVFTAFVISNIGHIRPQRTILAFVSGIFFILSGLSLVVGLVLYISSINDEVMNRPREPEQFFHYRYGWSFAFAASSFLLKEGAGVMSVYLFMKRYAEEELYRPHPTLYRPRMSDCSDYSGQFLHPDSWPPPQRGRSPSDVSSDISIQLNQTPPPQPPPKGGSSSQPTPSSSGPSSAASYQLQPASSSSTSSSYPHPLHPAATSTLPRVSHAHAHTHGHPHPQPHPHPHPSGPPPQSMPMAGPPSHVPPPRYHTHMRMSASPC